MSDLGRRLRHYRQRAGLSIYDVEKLTGRHFSTISKYERGERHPRIETVRELAEIYEVPPARLITEVSDVEEMLPEEVVEAARILQQRPDIAEIIPELEQLQPEQILRLRQFISSVLSSH